MLTAPHESLCGISKYAYTCDVVLETRVLVSRRLEDKNESLGLGLKKSIDYITASF